MKAANKELKGMMKTVKLEDIDVCSIQDCFIALLVSLPPLHLNICICRACKMRWWILWMWAMKYKRLLVEATMSLMTSMRKNLWGVRLTFLDNLQSPLFSQAVWFTWSTHLCMVSSFCSLMNAELDALEADMDFESESVPSYLQPDKEPDQDSELNLPAAPTGHAAQPNQQQVIVQRFLAFMLLIHVRHST